MLDLGRFSANKFTVEEGLLTICEILAMIPLESVAMINP